MFLLTLFAVMLLEGTAFAERSKESSDNLNTTYVPPARYKPSLEALETKDIKASVDDKLHKPVNISRSGYTHNVTSVLPARFKPSLDTLETKDIKASVDKKQHKHLGKHPASSPDTDHKPMLEHTKHNSTGGKQMNSRDKHEKRFSKFPSTKNGRSSKNFDTSSSNTVEGKKETPANFSDNMAQTSMMFRSRGYPQVFKRGKGIVLRKYNLPSSNDYRSINSHHADSKRDESELPLYEFHTQPIVNVFEAFQGFNNSQKDGSMPSSFVYRMLNGYYADRNRSFYALQELGKRPLPKFLQWFKLPTTPPSLAPTYSYRSVRGPNLYSNSDERELPLYEFHTKPIVNVFEVSRGLDRPIKEGRMPSSYSHRSVNGHNSKSKINDNELPLYEFHTKPILNVFESSRGIKGPAKNGYRPSSYAYRSVNGYHADIKSNENKLPLYEYNTKRVPIVFEASQGLKSSLNDDRMPPAKAYGSVNGLNSDSESDDIVYGLFEFQTEPFLNVFETPRRLGSREKYNSNVNPPLYNIYKNGEDLYAAHSKQQSHVIRLP